MIIPGKRWISLWLIPPEIRGGDRPGSPQKFEAETALEASGTEKKTYK
jgi:hypothetical protein